MRNMLNRIVFTIYHLPKAMESIQDHLLKLRLNGRYVKPSTNTLGQFVIVCYGKWFVYSWFTYKTGNFPIDIQFFFVTIESQFCQAPPFKWDPQGSPSPAQWHWSPLISAHAHPGPGGVKINEDRSDKTKMWAPFVRNKMVISWDFMGGFMAAMVDPQSSPLVVSLVIHDDIPRWFGGTPSVKPSVFTSQRSHKNSGAQKFFRNLRTWI